MISWFIKVSTPVAGNQPFPKKVVEVLFAPDAPTDFPVAMQPSKKYNVFYLFTKMGYVHVYDMETGALIFMARMSSETVFASAVHHASSGIIAINKKGQVFSVSIDESNVVSYVNIKLNNPDLAFKSNLIWGWTYFQFICVLCFCQLTYKKLYWTKNP